MDVAPREVWGVFVTNGSEVDAGQMRVLPEVGLDNISDLHPKIYETRVDQAVVGAPHPPNICPTLRIRVDRTISKLRQRVS